MHHHQQPSTEKLSLSLPNPWTLNSPTDASWQKITVEQIRENPYLQYFIGQLTYSNELPFDSSLLVYFRQRISANLINKVNERMVNKIRETTPKPPEKKKDSEAKNESPNQGKLIIDATRTSVPLSEEKQGNP